MQGPGSKKWKTQMSIPRNGKGRPVYGMIRLESIDDLSRQKLSIFDKGLLLCLIGLAKYDGLVYHSQRAIADYAGTYQSNVSESLKRLKKLGYVLEEDETYRIDPVFCKFGSKKCKTENY